MTRDSSADIGVSRRLIPINAALRALLRTRMDDLQVRGYRALAGRTGGRVSRGSVHRILVGQQSSIRPGTLTALAEALDLAAADLAAAAQTQRSPWTLPEAFDGVAVELRPAIEHALAKLLEAGGVL